MQCRGAVSSKAQAVVLFDLSMNRSQLSRDHTYICIVMVALNCVL